MKFIIGTYLIAFLSSCSEYKPAIIPNEKTNIINKFVSECNKQGLFSGSVLIANNGKVIYKSSFGYSIIETEEINTIDTKYRIGSMTRQFTSMMIMQLAEEGKIKLDGKITDYLKDYRDDTGTNTLNTAKGYINSFLGMETSFLEMTNFIGAGNMYSTVEDLYK